MIILSHKLEKEVFVACSGGVDSMVVVDFLSKKHDVTALFFHHGNELADREHEFLKGKVKLKVAYGSGEKPKDQSSEEFWRNQRYEWFHSLNVPVITGHHLDDCVETWIWSSLHGEGKIIPYANKNVIRPFRLNRKAEFHDWAIKNKLEWLEDETNADEKHMRNFIRHTLMPKVLIVNPGIHKNIRKKVENEKQKFD